MKGNDSAEYPYLVLSYPDESSLWFIALASESLLQEASWSNEVLGTQDSADGGRGSACVVWPVNSRGLAIIVCTFFRQDPWSAVVRDCTPWSAFKVCCFKWVTFSDGSQTVFWSSATVFVSSSTLLFVCSAPDCACCGCFRGATRPSINPLSLHNWISLGFLADGLNGMLFCCSSALTLLLSSSVVCSDHILYWQH